MEERPKRAVAEARVVPGVPVAGEIDPGERRGGFLVEHDEAGLAPGDEVAVPAEPEAVALRQSGFQGRDEPAHAALALLPRSPGGSQVREPVRDRQNRVPRGTELEPRLRRAGERRRNHGRRERRPLPPLARDPPEKPERLLGPAQLPPRGAPAPGLAP